MDTGGTAGSGKPGKRKVSEEFRQKVGMLSSGARLLLQQQRCNGRWYVQADYLQTEMCCPAAAEIRATLSQVLGILQQNGFEDARVAKMGQDDILRLLACFNAAGIHFA